MYGLFAVRVTEQKSLEAAARVPVGHTPFSWGTDCVADSTSGVHALVPQGHTAFSWPTPQQPSAATFSRSQRSNLFAEDCREIEFYSGNPSVQICHGRVHLYTRRLESTSGLPAIVTQSNGDFQLDSEYQLFVLAIPSYMSLSDFCDFLGPELLPTVTHMRIVRDEDPSRYMALLGMKSLHAAEELRHQRNGLEFSSLSAEPDDKAASCVVLYVADLIWEDSCAEVSDDQQGQNCNTTSPAVFSTAPLGHVEVPRCAVCLDRLDPHASGILTVLCNHSFHADCLRKWGDSSCPVCRYCQQPEVTAVCGTCGRPDSLWMCLVCGFIGCGRYEEGAHGLEHHKQTGHNYAIELQTQRVWDYTGDCYVHRLIQNRVDGKMVEVADPNAAEESGKLGEALAKSMHTELIAEYEGLLTATLEAQRHHYDGQLASMGAEVSRLRRRLDITEKAFHAQKSELEAARKELSFLEAVNAEMRGNQGEWKQRAESAEAEVTSLQEEVRDLMFFVEGAKTVASMGPEHEAAGGGLEVAPARRSRKKKR